MRIRFATWNIHSWVGSDGRYDIDRIADVIRSFDADVIGLQEVDWRGAVDGEDPFEHLAGELGLGHIEGPNLEDHRGRYGNGLLTRLNIERHKNHSLAVNGREPRGAIDAVLKRDGFRVRVFVTHLGLKYRERQIQARHLHKEALGEPHTDACVLMGDLNEWISHRFIRRIFMLEPFRVLVSGRSFPSRRPLFGLDCILAGPELTIREGGVMQRSKAALASDHLPVVADIEWTY